MRSTPAPPPESPLSDGVLMLRLRRASDVDALAAASHDPESRRWLDDPPIELPVDDRVRAESVGRAAELWRTGRAAPFTIAELAPELRRTDGPADSSTSGDAGLGADRAAGLINVQFRDDALATVAYQVFPEFRGRGFAPRAVRLVVDWAFGDLGLAELRLEVDEANTASARVATKCGFERVAVRTEPDQTRASRTVLVFARRSC